MDVEQRTARYKNIMARQYDEMVKLRRFNIGDLVLKVSPCQLETRHMENWGLIGKDPTRLSIAKGRDHTIWKP